MTAVFNHMRTNRVVVGPAIKIVMEILCNIQMEENGVFSTTTASLLVGEKRTSMVGA